MLEGSQITIQTDHRPLVTALTKSDGAWLAKQRQLSAIAESSGTITYIPGSKYPVADALSRITIHDIQQGLDYDALSREQQTDPETDAYKTAVSNLIWEYVPINITQVLCEKSTGRPRPFAPTTFRRRIFDVVHELAQKKNNDIKKYI